MTDTHTHLYMPDAFPDGGIEAVENAIAAGVSRLIFPCVDIDSLKPMTTLRSRFPENIRLAIGLHPTDIGEDWSVQLDEMERMLPGDFVAIGEVGIDLYHDATTLPEQKDAFSRQLEWASRFELPVIIHCRDGLEDALDVISQAPHPLPNLIFHSFTGGIEDVKRIRRVCDPWFGINGVVTFKNAPLLREALVEIGIDRILLETDSPWLSPVPYRGRQNESSRIPFIRDKVAEVLDISPKEVEDITDRNAAALFGF